MLFWILKIYDKHSDVEGVQEGKHFDFRCGILIFKERQQNAMKCVKNEKVARKRKKGSIEIFSPGRHFVSQRCWTNNFENCSVIALYYLQSLIQNQFLNKYISLMYFTINNHDIT